MIRRSARTLALLGALLVSGCYEYLPARDPVALIGRRVQLSLTDSGTVALARQVGPSVEALEGTLLADSAGAYVIGVTLTRVRSGAEVDWRDERVSVPHSLVSSPPRSACGETVARPAAACRRPDAQAASDRQQDRHGRRQSRTSTLLLKSLSSVQMNSLP
jgi:hypothetical protein